MDCKNARLLLEFIHPGSAELDMAEAEALHQHLAECPDCAAQAREERRADEHLGRAMRDVPVPEGLRERVLKRLTVERDALYRRWIRRWVVRGVAAAAVIAGLWVGYLAWFNQPPAVTVDTVNQLASWKKRLGRDDVVNRFRTMYGVAVNPPENFNYELLDTFNLQILPKVSRPVPYLLFRYRDEGAKRIDEAHVYVLPSSQIDLQETMANIGTLSALDHYTPCVYYHHRDQDTLYLVLYTGHQFQRFGRGEPDH
jgi:hypothetical protein